MPDHLTREKILEYAARPQGFRATWRGKDRDVMRLCRLLVKQRKLIRTGRAPGGGPNIYHLNSED